MLLFLASLLMSLTAPPAPTMAQCDTQSFHASYRWDGFDLHLEGQYGASFALTSLKKLPVRVPGIGEAIATLGWGGEPCLFVERRGTLLRLCFETPQSFARQRGMVMQMMPDPREAEMAPGIERGFVAALEAGDGAALAAHPFIGAAAEVVAHLDTGAAVGVTRRPRVEALRAEINGREVVLDGQKLPAALGDEVGLRIIVAVGQQSCTLERAITVTVDPEELTGRLEQGERVWTGVRDGASLRFGLGTIVSLRRHRYHVTADGEQLTGEVLHRYGQPGEDRLSRGTQQTGLAAPEELTTKALRDQIANEIEASYDSDRHRLGTRWAQPALRVALQRRGRLGPERMALLAGPPDQVLLHDLPAPRWQDHRPPLRYEELRLSGPYADTLANESDGPDVIWEVDLAYALYSGLRFGTEAAEVARLAAFLMEQLDRQIEPTDCTRSKNRQCVISTHQGEGHAWALLALGFMARQGDRRAQQLAGRIAEHIIAHHLEPRDRAAATTPSDWQARVQEQLLLATALRRHLAETANGEREHGAVLAERQLFGTVQRGYRQLSLAVLADLYDYLEGSPFLLGPSG